MTIQPHYRNFNVDLHWPEAGGKITLTYNGSDYEATYDGEKPPIKVLKRLIRSPERAFASEKWQVEAGRALAQAFFPEDGLGAEFRKLLRQHKRVRLRLFYPEDHDEVERLLGVPWEYLYIDAPPGSGFKLSGFLCLEEGFSLAHCVTSSSIRPAVKRLPLTVAFLSAMVAEDGDHSGGGGNHAANEDALQKEFEEVEEELRREKRQRIVRMWHLQKRTQKVNFNMAFRDCEIVQSLSHGSETAFFLHGKKVTAKTLEDLVEYSEEHRAKAVVLCACESGRSPSGPAVTLHKAGVPVVIGMTQSMATKKVCQLMESFYVRLATNICSLEEALATARWHLLESKETGSDDPNGTEAEERVMSLDWGMPRLYLAASSSNLILKRHLYQPIFNLPQQFEDMISERLKKLEGDGVTPASDEVQKKIQRWVEGNQEILYLSGPSGSGKSTEIARFLDANRGNSQIIRHICTEPGCRRDITNDPLAFIQDSLVPQLETYYGKELYRSWIGEDVYPLRDAPQDVFLDLVINPLQRACARALKERAILVLDGLDHAAKSSPSCSILDVLTAHNRYTLTQGARLIVTADSDQEDVHARIIAELKPDTTISIELAAEAQLWADLKTDERFSAFLSATSLQVPDWLRQPFTYQQVQQLAERVGVDELLAQVEGLVAGRNLEEKLRSDVRPVFLQITKQARAVQPLVDDMGLPDWLLRPIPWQVWQFVMHVIEDLTTHGGAKAAEKLFNIMLHQIATTYDEQDDPSANLRKYYRTYLDFILDWSAEQAEQIKRLLEALAVAYLPLQVDMIAQLVDLAPGQDVNHLINQVSGFLEELPQSQRFVCEHPSIKRFLYSVFPTDEAHALFIEMYRAKIGDGPWKGVGDWSELFGNSYEQVYLADYAQSHLSDHAYERYRNTDWEDDARSRRADDFLNLVTAPGFRTFRLDRGLQAALEDVRRALRVVLIETMPPGDAQPRQALDTIERLLAAYNSEHNAAIIDLEQRVRCKNGGIPALREFLGLPA